jgi:ankyrin repeat protein
MQSPIKWIITPLLIILLLGCGKKPWDEPELHSAAQKGDLQQVTQLLASGIDVNSLNREGATPLHWAAFKGHLKVAKLLVSKGAKINPLTKKGSTPLRLATTHKKHKLIAYLKSKGGRI